jgi:hypothetical protein
MLDLMPPPPERLNAPSTRRIPAGTRAPIGEFDQNLRSADRRSRDASSVGASAAQRAAGLRAPTAQSIRAPWSHACHLIFSRRAGGFEPSRRRFVTGLAVGGVAAGAGLWRVPAFASSGLATSPQTLTGTQFDLSIGASPVNLTGATRTAVTVNGSLPAPVLRLARRRLGHAACRQPYSACRARCIGTASCCRPTWTVCRA